MLSNKHRLTSLEIPHWCFLRRIIQFHEFIFYFLVQTTIAGSFLKCEIISSFRFFHKTLLNIPISLKKFEENVESWYHDGTIVANILELEMVLHCFNFNRIPYLCSMYYAKHTDNFMWVAFWLSFALFNIALQVWLFALSWKINPIYFDTDLHQAILKSRYIPHRRL